jgi:hypothetical protein
MYSVYQHWDPLKVCVVGRSYPPEFYSWIQVPHVRSLFEKIAIETEEDYLALEKKLQEFGVHVLRPNITDLDICIGGKYVPPPMTPRDHNVMIGNRFFENRRLHFDSKNESVFTQYYLDVKHPNWPDCKDLEEFYNLPNWIQKECTEVHNFDKIVRYYSWYDHIDQHIMQQGNTIQQSRFPKNINGAMISRIGQDLFFGTSDYTQDQKSLKTYIDQEFTHARNHVMNTGGHSDGTYCLIAPGLIISTPDIPTYKRKFPDWEVFYLKEPDLGGIGLFSQLKRKNYGKWWIPGFEQDQSVIDTVETWLGHWTGYVEETVFDVNMLIIDPKNVLVVNYNKALFECLERHGITAHVVPFRHRFFWDGGLHCVTSDLHREGQMKNYFSDQ